MHRLRILPSCFAAAAGLLALNGCATAPIGATHGAAAPGAARFAGTWNGVVHWAAVVGSLPTTFIIDGTGRSARDPATGMVAATRLHGGSISWKMGPLGTQQWTLTPDAAGRTAEVVAKDVLNSGFGTFERAGGAPAVAPTTPAPKRKPSTPSQPAPRKPKSASPQAWR